MKTFYNGKWQTSSVGIDVYNPFDNKIIGQIGALNVADIECAIDYLHKNRKHLLAIDRSHILERLADKIYENQELLAQSISLESGIPIKTSRMEVMRSFQATTYAAEESKRIIGESYPMDITENRHQKICYTSYFPVGIVSAITPFNHPLNQLIHKVTPAIAAGNSILLKPSEKTPLTAIKLVELILESGFPNTNIALVMGPIKEIGKVLVAHPNVDMVSFTGSIEIGEEIHKTCGVKKLCLELGGNSVLIVMDDVDPDWAAKIAIHGAFSNNGQRCTSVKRILLHNKIADQFIPAFTSLVREMKVGNQLDPEVDIGPVIDVEAAKKIERVVDLAIKDGAKCLVGGKREGAIYFPTILDHVSPKSEIVREETFGPTAPIIRINSLEEAIQIANSTQFGLSDAILTNNIHHAQKAIASLNSGTVVVNEAPGLRVESLPFGGVKKSGVGREGIRFAIREMSNLKTIIM